MSRTKFYAVVVRELFTTEIDSLYNNIEDARSRLFCLEKLKPSFPGYTKIEVQEFLMNQPNGRL